ncbi:MAG: hypothetical protein KAW92_09180 [Candidatus Cloacimonetes bacterium]|nr:hypothetical protein [Candidatus Cloacimonadota bacterium]
MKPICQRVDAKKNENNNKVGILKKKVIIIICVNQFNQCNLCAIFI